MWTKQEDITALAKRVCEGRDEVAAGKLWRVYYGQLRAIARRNLHVNPVVDDEDIALSALNSFFAAAEAGRFEIENRNDLWKLLVTITIRKTYRVAEGENAARRKSKPTREIDEIAINDLAKHLDLQTRESVNLLTGQHHRTIAELRLEGYSIEEIAENVGIATSTVKRKLKRIREIWDS